MRLTGRTLTTVRPAGAGRWVTERQVFERDLNGQLRLVVNETEDLIGRVDPPPRLPAVARV